MATRQPSYGGPNPKPSGSDPRGRVQNQSGYQQQRFENQQGPAASEFARRFGQAAERQYDDYGDIMRRYGDVASGGGAGKLGRNQVSWTDPFKSYGGYEEFSTTGGYSPTDIANMRARGVSPIRAAYANAQRGIGQQRALQGGYSPNAIATRAKMAREQGQSMADATQNVEAGLAEARNRGRLAGLSGMSGIEGQRLAAQLDAGKFNAATLNAADETDQLNQLRALQGMTSLYGTTPGMAQLFGNQLNTSIGQGANYGINQQQVDIEGQKLPGAWDSAMGKIGDIMDIAGAASTMAYPWLNDGEQMPFANGGYTWNRNPGGQPLPIYSPQRRPGFTGWAGPNY